MDGFRCVPFFALFGEAREIEPMIVIVPCFMGAVSLAPVPKICSLIKWVQQPAVAGTLRDAVSASHAPSGLVRIIRGHGPITKEDMKEWL
jgi:hypothetical protein